VISRRRPERTPAVRWFAGRRWRAARWRADVDRGQFVGCEWDRFAILIDLLVRASVDRRNTGTGDRRGPSLLPEVRRQEQSAHRPACDRRRACAWRFDAITSSSRWPHGKRFFRRSSAGRRSWSESAGPRGLGEACCGPPVAAGAGVSTTRGR